VTRFRLRLPARREAAPTAAVPMGVARTRTPMAAAIRMALVAGRAGAR